MENLTGKYNNRLIFLTFCSKSVNWLSNIRLLQKSQYSPCFGQQLMPTKAFEHFGKVLQCPVNLQILLQNPLYMGLFGIDQIFQEFGFGFWEKTNELYVG